MTSKLDDIQDRNIAAAFSVLDSNGSGTITEQDFDLLCRQICGRFGIEADGAAGRDIRETYRDWWEQLQRDLDTDNDGQITLAEFVDAYKNGKGDPQAYFKEQLGRVVTVVAEAMDADHDGFISEGEYLTLLSVATDNQEVALDGFRKLDIDGDGRISIEEFQLGCRELMLSNDPNAPGTAILGQT